jgi:cytochrome c-type biogenesis protein CcmH
MRREVRWMLSQGKSPEEIRDRYISEYGVRILSIPPPRGFNLWVYILPVLALVGGRSVLKWVLGGWGKKAMIPVVDRVPFVEGTYATRLETELRERD